MYIQDCYSEDLREEVHLRLKCMGIKSSLKKLNSKSNLDASSNKVFNTSLTCLDKQAVLLRHSGALVHIPSFLVNACNHIRSDLAVEGIFRKAGSLSRQNLIKARIENGGSFIPDDHVIDVANILKQFLRALPEPLIPYNLHETFIKCLSLKGKEVETVLLACLLLPAENMDCLTYLIEFLNEVIALKDFNKMSSGNIAILFAPNIMPVKAKSSQLDLNRNTSNHTKIIRIFLENASLLGAVPDFICKRPSLDDQRRRRNSGSLTRIVTGFKKMVGKVSSNTSDPHLNARSNVPVTPSISNPVVPVLSAKKRKVHDTPTPSFSTKKRREVMRCLPEGSILPKSPMVPKCFSSRLAVADYRSCNNDTPDSALILGNGRSSSGSSNNIEACDEGSQHFGRIFNAASSGPHSGLRRLSNFSRRKLKAVKLMKCSSSPALAIDPDSQTETNLMTTPRRLAMSQDNCYAQFMEGDFVRVPKKEYEEIKSRVSEIESRISAEFGSIGVLSSDSDGSQEDLRPTSKVDEVQSQYQKTLRHTERLSDVCTDSIAQHLSRELKIRHSAGGRVMRSPSQRKIGSIRRRSQERIPRRELSRNLSLNLPRTRIPYLVRSCSLQRGRPNTLSSGLNSNRLTRSASDKSRRRPEIIKTRPQPLILKSTPLAKTNSCTSAQPRNTVIGSSSSMPLEAGETWRNAQSFLADSSLEKKAYFLNSDRRESVKQIRVQNAGMVLEKAKMFSSIADGSTIGPQPRRVQSVGNFVTCVKLNSQVNPAENSSLSKITEPPHFPGKENLNTNAKEALVSPSVYKTPVSSFLHRSHRSVKSPHSSGKKLLNRQVGRTQSDRTPYKTVITIGTPRRSPRLNELKK